MHSTGMPAGVEETRGRLGKGAWCKKRGVLRGRCREGLGGEEPGREDEIRGGSGSRKGSGEG